MFVFLDGVVYNSTKFLDITSPFKRIIGTEGRRGPKGESGTPGEKGDPGSFDFLMLMVSDLRHDLEQMKARAYPNGASSSSLPANRIGSTPPVGFTRHIEIPCNIKIIYYV